MEMIESPTIDKYIFFSVFFFNVRIEFRINAGQMWTYDINTHTYTHRHWARATGACGEKSKEHLRIGYSPVTYFKRKFDLRQNKIAFRWVRMTQIQTINEIWPVETLNTLQIWALCKWIMEWIRYIVNRLTNGFKLVLFFFFFVELKNGHAIIKHAQDGVCSWCIPWKIKQRYTIATKWPPWAMRWNCYLIIHLFTLSWVQRPQFFLSLARHFPLSKCRPDSILFYREIDVTMASAHRRLTWTVTNAYHLQTKPKLK